MSISASNLSNAIYNKQDTITSSSILTLSNLSASNLTVPSISLKNSAYTSTYFTINYDSVNDIYKIDSAGLGIYTTRRLGIATNNNRYPLTVGKSTSVSQFNVGYDHNYFNYNTNLTTNINGTVVYSDVCAVMNGSLLAGNKVASASDRRIKTNIQDIIDDNALQLIMKIEPKTYEYIDKIQKGDKNVYGFIAQQVKEVIPEAVSLEPSTIPNIYKIGTLSHSNVITVDTDISEIIGIGSNISLITSNLGTKEYTISEVPQSNQFKITTNIEDNDNIINSNIFVYGTKVKDFHTLNKDYIFTLNVCATQELYKLINLQTNKINELKNKFAIMANKIQIQEQKINIITNNNGI